MVSSPLVLCFICILFHLFTFSWTNLLTRCPVRVSCCLLFFVSEKLHMNILLISPDKHPGSHFPVTYTESKEETEGSPEAPTPPGGATPPLATPGHGVGPTGASYHRTSAYLYPPDVKTLKSSIIFHEKFLVSEGPVRAPCRDMDWPPEPSPSTPPPPLRIHDGL